MAISQKNSNNPEKQISVSEKKCPVSAGTAVFLIFSFLLIVGLCKFSFYVLKTHRSAVNRETLVKTYVDVQPYSGARKEKSSYIVLRNQDKAAPAPFFVSDTPTTDLQKTLSKKQNPEIAPLPVLTTKTQKVSEISPVAATIKRPPVIRTTEDAPVRSLPEKEIKPEDKKQEIASLDNLMISGMALLSETDESVIASEILLQEESLTDDLKSTEKKVDASNATIRTADIQQLQKKAEKKQPETKKTVKKKSAPETRWVDIAQLRLELSGSKEKEEIKRKNAALLEMNDSRQTAALNTQTATDVFAETSETVSTAAKLQTVSDSLPAETNQTTATTVSNETSQARQIAVVQDVPFAGTAENSHTPSVQTAVVQDVPFAGTAESPRQTAVVNQKAFLAGDAPSLWKIAKARGKPKNSLATKEADPLPQSAKEPIESVAMSSVGQKQEKPTVIYKNGKVSAVIQNQSQKSLNWLDRQEAAVWTSMSQSDTPSVWSTAADAENVSADRAKAFRVANEQPEQSDKKQTPTEKNGESSDNVISSQPVRVIGEEQKPEVKINPILLPLGTQASSATKETPAVPAIVPANPSVLPPKVNPEGLASTLSSATETKSEKTAEKNEENGLVNKLFSFFGKTETDSLPSVGTGTAVPQQTETKNKQKRQKTKITDQNTLQASAQQTKSAEKEIVPTEMRLTFKPDSSEMSAQSVKWIKAFGQRAKKDIQNAVEVRMSNINPDLQEKRFALIHSILTGVGMEDVQIIPVMTDRTPHTIVLRMIVLPEEGYTEYTSDNGGIQERMYYKKW